jgi:membrane protease YdiL (CAAX protease family)
MIARRQWQSSAEVVLCSGFPTQLFLSSLATLAGLGPLTDAGGLSLRFVAVVSAADTLLLGALVWWFLHLRHESPRQVLLGDRRASREMAVGLLLAPGVVVFMSGGMWWLRQVLPGLQTVPENPFELMAASPLGAIALLLVAVGAGGVREEVQRGFLLHRFREDLGGPVNGLVLTSVVFGLGHVVQGWDAVLVTGALGAFWGALYYTRGSILAALVSHALANGAQVGFAYLKGIEGLGS